MCSLAGAWARPAGIANNRRQDTIVNFGIVFFLQAQRGNRAIRGAGSRIKRSLTAVKGVALIFEREMLHLRGKTLQSGMACMSTGKTLYLIALSGARKLKRRSLLAPPSRLKDVSVSG